MNDTSSVQRSSLHAFFQAGTILLTAAMLPAQSFPFEWEQGTLEQGSLDMLYGSGRLVTVQYSFDSPDVIANVSLDGGWTWESSVIYSDNLRFVDKLIYVNGSFWLNTQRGGGAGLYISDDGLNWEMRNMGSGIINGVAYGNDTFVAVGGGAGTFNVRTSPDGENWTSHDTGTISYLDNVTFGNGVFVYSMMTDGDEVGLHYSATGTDWEEAEINGLVNSPYRIQNIVFGNGVFVATGTYNSSLDGGPFVLVSEDGMSWDRLEEDSLHWIDKLAFGDGLFVSATRQGQNFTIQYSEDGRNWTPQTMDILLWPDSLIFADGLWMLFSRDSGNNTLLTAGSYEGPVGGPSYAWLGLVWELDDGWIYHAEHGYLFAHAGPASSAYLYDLSLGWLWTSAALYPNFYRYDPAGWIYYFTGGNPEQRHFYDQTEDLYFVIP